MFKYIGVLLLGLVLVGCNTAYGQVNIPTNVEVSTEDGPVALITGPDEIQTGRPAWFKTLGSEGNEFQWKIIPEEANEDFVTLSVYGGLDENGKPIINPLGHFSSTKPGIYYILLIATKDNRSNVAVHKLVNGDGIPNPDPDPDPDPDPVDIVIEIPTPSTSMKELVDGIAELIKGPNAKVDGRDLAMFYMDLADVVERDSESQTIKDTLSIRTLHVRAGKLMFQETGIDGRYRNLGQEINRVLEKQLGLEVKQLDDQKRRDVVEVLEAIAWAALEASK